MYTAKKDFKSYMQGDIKAGQVVQFNADWLEAGLIEEKPAIEPELETKPQPQKRKPKR